MRIIGIDIQNFRKLFGCHIDISKKKQLCLWGQITAEKLQRWMLLQNF